MTSEELPLTEFAFVSLHEIVESSGLDTSEVQELIDLGVLEPQPREGAEEMFVARSIELARSARRLQRDFELPLSAVALALAYREQIRELEARLHLLECQLPGGARS